MRTALDICVRARSFGPAQGRETRRVGHELDAGVEAGS
jgi:hypothetical protein